MESNRKIEKIRLEDSIIQICENRANIKEQEEIMNSEWFINWIKENPECGINRKTAKAIWRSCGKSNSDFDSYIWKNN